MLRRFGLGPPSPMNYGGAVQRPSPRPRGGARYMNQYSGPDPCYDCADIGGTHLCGSCADELYGGPVYNVVTCSCPHCEHNDPGGYGGGYPSYPRANYRSGNRRQANPFAGPMAPYFISGYGGAYGGAYSGGRGLHGRGGVGRMGY
ncbi:uncharacterized protein BP5553_08912 [Venustampulla echinocandica]|uniref:Uncharacterized protein n=1 Tax=Venustampulla echinocandica TaxID=2656787 RepID=A0A370TDD0_9HELO|nr:uncharacterized protein BP5553_08912 [Venustampulla echinocandica]RDL32456.1 hypothetical protein BP5553_08912 [Venustampulla echinocandica]